jgi:hypothetical protein
MPGKGRWRELKKLWIITSLVKFSYVAFMYWWLFWDALIRNSISPAERLALTLRCLATGELIISLFLKAAQLLMALTALDNNFTGTILLRCIYALGIFFFNFVF